MQNNRHCVVER